MYASIDLQLIKFCHQLNVDTITEQANLSIQCVICSIYQKPGPVELHIIHGNSTVIHGLSNTMGYSVILLFGYADILLRFDVCNDCDKE